MNLFELFVRIGVKDEASNHISSLSEKLGNGLKAAAKIGTAAVGIASSGIVAMTKSAVENYAEYEQLVGGAELLFGKAFDSVQEKAAAAYKNVQMSQSEYLQQVNGFATGLKTALGGNEQAAAELADRIITAEADIVAATGGSQEAIQNAFNGIMKSNYTMVDNLQLGITPTKEGFQEMIDKVNEWNEAQGKATDYQIDNLADAQSALLDYIDMQGLSGYASMEAANTISGSVASMKASWQNLVTGVADENANFEELVTQFVDSAMIAADNLIPRVEIALDGAGQMLDVVVPKIIDKIPEWIEKYSPKILEGGVSIVIAIIAGLLKAAPDLIEMVPQLVKTFVTTFKGHSADFKGIGKDIVTGVWNGISAMVSWFTGKVKSFFGGIVNSVKKTLGINSPSKVFASIGGYMAEGVGVGWDKEYDTVKSNIDKAMTFDKTKVNFKVGTVDYSNSGMGRTSGAAAAVASAARAAGENMTIVVQSVLDGKVIGETAYQYGKNKERMYGMA